MSYAEAGLRDGIRSATSPSLLKSHKITVMYAVRSLNAQLLRAVVQPDSRVLMRVAYSAPCLIEAGSGRFHQVPVRPSPKEPRRRQVRAAIRILTLVFTRSRLSEHSGVDHKYARPY